jgi:DNA-binding transcriptional LysR family regulator
MELRQLVTFQAVVREGSFLKAARALRYAQSTVTLHVQQLEAELGLALFARHGKRASLTEAGRALAGETTRVVERIDALRRVMAELGSGLSGEVRLGAIEPTASLRLPALLARLCRERPRLALSIEVGGTDSLARLVADGRLDAALASPPPAALGLVFEPLFDERLAVLIPSDHRLARKRPLRAVDLAGERLLVTHPRCAYRQAAQAGLAAAGANPTVGIEIGSVPAIVASVTQGMGIALVPAVAATPTPPGAAVRTLADLPLALPVGLVRRADAGRAGPALEACLAAVRDHLGAARPHQRAQPAT